MAYVPPQLRQRRSNDASSTAEPRKRAKSPSTENEDAAARSLREISEHFWPTAPETREASKDALRSGTMHDSAATPDRLAYIVLFNEANPKWASEGVIFTKTELELLPAQLPKVQDLPQQRRMSRGQRRASGAEAESPARLRKSSNTAASPILDSATKPRQLSNTASSPTSEQEEEHNAPILQHDPVAVFDQTGSNRNGRSFRFIGWHKVTSITLIEPNTLALARMLEQKWSRNDRFGNTQPVKRDAVRWNESLGYRWAVVKLEKDAEAEREKGELVVAKLPDAGGLEDWKGRKKSVNELPAEMRMGCEGK